MNAAVSVYKTIGTDENMIYAADGLHVLGKNAALAKKYSQADSYYDQAIQIMRAHAKGDETLKEEIDKMITEQKMVRAHK
jgi:hypothetical protein